MRTFRRRGFTLVEVIVALAVLLIGVVGVLQFFPTTLRASSDASMRGEAVLLALRKVEELRRDDTAAAGMITSIKALTAPTDAVPFAEDDRLAYQFHSRSLLQPTDTPASVEDDHNVARIIVRYNPTFRAKSDILFELRFDDGF